MGHRPLLRQPGSPEPRPCKQGRAAVLGQCGTHSFSQTWKVRGGTTSASKGSFCCPQRFFFFCILRSGCGVWGTPTFVKKPSLHIKMPAYAGRPAFQLMHIPICWPVCVCTSASSSDGRRQTCLPCAPALRRPTPPLRRPYP